jgi:NhaP-type Na+/H+ and K+/H+ antiporter
MLIVVILGVALLLSGIGQTDPQLTIVLFVVLVGMALLGLAFVPVAGRIIRTRYTNRLLKLQNQYVDTLSKAADKQIEYGMRLRSDAVAPLTRLIEAQTAIQTAQLERLRAAEQEMAQIETELNKLGKRTVLGVTVR